MVLRLIQIWCLIDRSLTLRKQRFKRLIISISLVTIDGRQLQVLVLKTWILTEATLRLLSGILEVVYCPGYVLVHHEASS